MGITGVMLCDTRMRTRFAFILIAVAIADPTRAVRAVARHDAKTVAPTVGRWVCDEDS